MLLSVELNQSNCVLTTVCEIFQQANSRENISGEISLLRQQCAQFIAEERLRYTKSDGDIVVRMCEFPRAKLRPSLYVALMSNVRRVKCNSNNIDN